MKYNLHTLEVFVTEIGLDEEMKLSTRPSSLRPDLACSFDEVREVSVIPTSNSFAQILALQSWAVSEYHMDDFVKVSRVILLCATELSLPLLLPSKPVLIVAATLRKGEVKESEIKEPSA